MAIPLLLLLLGHGLSDLERRLLDARDEAVGESPGLGPLIERLHADGLLPGHAAGGEDDDPSRLQKLPHLELMAMLAI